MAICYAALLDKCENKQRHELELECASTNPPWQLSLPSVFHPAALQLPFSFSPASLQLPSSFSPAALQLPSSFSLPSLDCMQSSSFLQCFIFAVLLSEQQQQHHVNIINCATASQLLTVPISSSLSPSLPLSPCCVVCLLSLKCA